MTDQITITLPDGSQKSAPKNISVEEFVKTGIGAGLAKAALYAKVNGQDVDLSRPLTEDATLQIFTPKSGAEALELIRHDSAHVVASVVQRLFPGTQVTIGPATEEGFYYDFAREKPFDPDELALIEKEANEEVKKNLPFVRTEISMEDAIKLFEGKGEKFKVEIVKDIAAKGAKTLTLYSHGDWVDFCLGPHAPSTGKIGVIKILSSSGAYWRGDSKNPMLQRIYGTAFFDQKALTEYLNRIEESKKRDHRKLGVALDLFHFHPASPGAAFWTDKGTRLYSTLSDYMRKLTRLNGYLEIKTPLLFNKLLWEKSGHWGKYRENMFMVLDSETGEHDYSLKPMNCPSHHLFYGMKRHSYRDLPLRFHTQDVLHRNEATGSLGGLTRVRQFAQDDAHIYCMESQIGDEVRAFVTLLDKVYNAVGLTYSAKFSTRPEKRLGDDATWDRAETALKGVLDTLNVPYEIKHGEGAFYGPKIDFDVSDSIGRKWQLGTMQLDYLAADRFELGYIGEDNAEHRPVVLHRAIYGSFERFIAILIEHFAGAFPAWLAPVQVTALSVAERHDAHARKLIQGLNEKGFRAHFDDRGMSLNAKIREAQIQKTPFTLVFGDNELKDNTVTLRRYGKEGQQTLKLEEFVELLGKETAYPL